MNNNDFQTGVAKVTGTSGPCVTVRCPHCHRTHRHDRRAVGSQAVVAGCHRGHTTARIYAIPSAPRR